MSRQNVELKARVGELAHLAKTAAEIGAAYAGRLRQVDTYFDCRRGRLKLRETVGQPAELVWYERPDANQARISDYHLTPVADAESLKFALAQALGIRVVVDKTRDLHLWHNVRIHLDTVAGLGTFLEFEAVLGNGIDAAAGHEQLRQLCETFGIDKGMIESLSYSDLLMSASATRR